MKTVLVTGGSSGIGEQLVRELVEIGYRVYFSYCTGYERAKKIASETGAIPKYLNLLLYAFLIHYIHDMHLKEH